MNFPSTSSPVIKLLLSMDWMTTLIVIFLLGMSIICGAIVLQKYKQFAAHKKALPLFMQEVQKAETMNDLISVGREFNDSLGGKVLATSLSNVKKMMSNPETGEVKSTLTEEDFEHFSVRADQVVEQAVVEQEEYLPFLGTSASVSPLIGLFGTVWGLIHAFLNISAEKSADIAVVAPGIAEALVTTLAGLVVAIPAMMFFHYFSNELRKIEQQLYMASDVMQSLVKRTFVR